MLAGSDMHMMTNRCLPEYVERAKIAAAFMIGIFFDSGSFTISFHFNFCPRSVSVLILRSSS
jgi:hypothetical protein